MNLRVNFILVPAVTAHDLEAIHEMVERTVKTSVLGRVISGIEFEEGDGDIRIIDAPPNPDLPPASGDGLGSLQPTPVPVG